MTPRSKGKVIGNVKGNYFETGMSM
jgi:hypothetical protein